MPDTRRPPEDASPSAPAPAYRVWLSPDASPIPAPAEHTVLQSALAAGIELLSSCRNGSCRVCIRQLVSGSVHYRMEWPGLSAEEKAEGYILPCVAHPAEDLVLQPLPTH